MPVCECQYTHTLTKVHVCKQKTTLDVSFGFYLAGSSCLLLMHSLCQAGWLKVSRHSPISTSQALLEPWDYRYVLQCQAFSNTWGLRNSNSGP